MFETEYIRKHMCLYAVTDESWLGGRTLEACVEEALIGGATFVQLRSKNGFISSGEDTAYRIKNLCKKHGAPFVINDDVDFAQKINADGIHIGQDDISCINARLLLGHEKIIGVSVHTTEQACVAQAEGADYLGVGALFSTATKSDSSLVSLEVLTAICEAVTIPVVAIGGLNEKTIPQLIGTGIDGVAVVSALFASQDICGAAKQLRSLADEVLC